MARILVTGANGFTGQHLLERLARDGHELHGLVHDGSETALLRAVVDSYARLLETPAAIGGLFNVCSGKAHSLGEVIALVEHLSGQHMDVKVNPAFVRANEVKTLCGSRARLESVIGPLAMPSLRDTLAWMLGA